MSVIVFIRYSLLLIGLIMIGAPAADLIVRWGVGPAVALIGLFSPQLVQLLKAGYENQAVGCSFLWSGEMPTDEAIGAPPARKIYDDFGMQWQYQVTEPVIKALTQTASERGHWKISHEPWPDDHGWHAQVEFEGWPVELLVQWSGPERNRFAVEAWFPKHLLYRIRDAKLFEHRREKLRAALFELQRCQSIV